MKSIHLLIQPYDKASSARVDVWVAAARDPAAYGVNGVDWSAAFDTLPEISGTVFSPALDGKLQLLSARFSFLINRLKLPAGIKAANLSWNDAPVTIWSVNDVNWSTRQTLLTGITRNADPDAARRKMSIDVSGASDFLNIDLLQQVFTGAGGVNGEPDSRDKLKPMGFGYVENLEPVFYDNTRSMAMLDGYGNLTSIDWVAEGLNRYTSYAGNYASEALLAAALDAGTILDGQWASCLSAGVIGFGAPPIGVVTCAATFGGTRTGAILKTMILNRVGIAAGKVDTASFDSLDAAMPRDVRFWTASQENLQNMIERMCGAVLATPIIDNLGRIAVSQALGGSSIVSLDKSGNTIPRVVAHRPANDWTPVARTVARAARPAVILRRDQVNFDDDFDPQGVFNSAASYRIGMTVYGPDNAEWLYINTTPALGSAAPLPVWPTASNAWWQNIGPPTVWSAIYARPPLLTGPSLTVDETFQDPSSWSYTQITFLKDATGEGYVRQTGTPTGVFTHFPQTSVPIDDNASYEASWDLQEEGAGAGAAIFYTIVQLYDANGVNIAGDGSYWFYQSANVPVTAKGVYETHSARFGRGTDRPFPSNAVRYSLGAIMNYTNLNTSTRVRRVFARKITTLEMTSALLRHWALGDGKAIRNLGIQSWGIAPAYGRSSIRGPQIMSFRFVGPNSSSTAKMAGLTESAAPADFAAGAMLIYYSDTADRIEIRVAGTEVATYTGITTRQGDEFAVEYDGLFLRPLRNGVRMGYELNVGPNKTYRSMVDSYYPEQGITQLYHRSTVSSAVIGGNTVDINGNPVPLDALRNNLLDLDWWKKGATIPFTGVGNPGATRAIVTIPTDLAVEGLKENPEDVMRVTKTGASGPIDGGGWNNTEIRPALNPDKTYRFIIPVRRVAGDSNLYWGTSGDICDLNTTTFQSNPYFVATVASYLEVDRWYVFVGFIYPRNSTGKTHNNAGVYDCRTGKKIVGPTALNFCFAPTFNIVGHRAFQYYGAVDSTALFGRPVISLVDGSEPELSSYFEQTAALEDVSLDWTNTFFQIALGNTIIKTLGAADAWDGKSLTKQSYKSTAFISGRLEDVNTFLGLHELGNVVGSYSSLLYSVHRSGSEWYIYSNGAALLNMGATYNGVTFNSLTDWAVFYDNQNVRVFADGVLMWEAVATPDKTFQGGVAIYAINAKVSNIRFGPWTDNSQVTTLAPPDIIINADYLGTIIGGQFDKIATPTVKRGGTDVRTSNRATYSITDVGAGLTGLISVNNVGGSADKGKATITGLTATSTYKHNIFWDGVLVNAHVVTVKIEPANPPTGGGGGGGGSYASISVVGDSVGTTTFTEVARISNVAKGTGQTITGSLAAAGYNYSASTTGSRTMTAKAQISPAGAETWSDMDAAVNGTAATWDAVDLSGDPGYITLSHPEAPANGNYDVRLVIAKTVGGGGGLTFFYGDFVVSVA